MTLNGKRDHFTRDDLRTCAQRVALRRGRAEAILQEVRAAVSRWPEYAQEAGVPSQWRDLIAHSHRMDL
jgi:serine/threonine-protein kinase HipA